ncbi:MAG: hypothetical protein RLZZ08_235 [Pseudomonadota bacterium]|jgi:type IV secretion system protein VirB6
MNLAMCQQAVQAVGSGVAASLQGVDCAAGAMAQMAFGRLFGTDGALMPALTILLTLYVAFFAFSLITGRGSLGVSALTPRMLTLGLVLTFATSWVAFQSVVWNLAVGAPDYLATLILGADGPGGGSATQVFAQKIDVVFAALIQSAGQGAADGAQSTFSPPGLLWLGGTLLLLGTAGLLATCKIAMSVLLSIGPVFIVMAMFKSTRGLFTGWLKGLVMLAVAPLFAVLGGSLMLELAVPVLSALGETPGVIDPRAAMAFFMIGAVHLALMVMVLKVAGTMVSGWTVFGMTDSSADKDRDDSAWPARAQASATIAATARSEAAQGPATTRQIRVAATAPAAANDAGASAATVLRRETRIVSGSAPQAEATGPGPSRARGIGSRFRAPAARTNAGPTTSSASPSARIPEKTR